jgi:Flp pilus assembly protein TadG
VERGITGQEAHVRQTSAHRASRRREGGAAAVEFALVLPVLLLVLFGAIQYGVYFWSMQGGSSAVRQGAREAAVGNFDSCSEFRSYVKDRIGSTSSDVSGATIKRTYQTAAGASVGAGNVAEGNVVTVTVEFKSYDFNLPFLPFINDGVVTESADSRVEDVDTTQPEICS